MKKINMLKKVLLTILLFVCTGFCMVMAQDNQQNYNRQTSFGASQNATQQYTTSQYNTQQPYFSGQNSQQQDIQQQYPQQQYSQQQYPQQQYLQQSYSKQQNISQSPYALKQQNSQQQINPPKQTYTSQKPYNKQQTFDKLTDQQTNEQVQSESFVEKDFSTDSNTELKQIGYDFFYNAPSQGFGKHDGNYKLNIGEKVNVYFWGDSVDMLSLSGSPMLLPLTKTQVDTKGNVFVPGVGVINAEGRSISEVEREIQSMASQKFTNAKVRITIADSTEFPVFVYGFVNKPGRVTISTNSSIIEALAAAGGVKKTGSLRNVTCKSASGISQKVDLYNIIFNGKDSGLRLQPNDVIYVNKLGSVVALKNGVEVPGIYEVTSSDSVSAVINYAGGLLPSTDKSTVNVKAYKNGQRVSSDVHFDSFNQAKLVNGDILEFRGLFGLAENVVTLEGNVKHPGIFEYRKGMKLSDVLKNKNELMDETFIHQAVITRVVSANGNRVVTIPVSLEEFFHGGNNPVLHQKDIITVFKSTTGNFVDVYGCINNPKRVPYNENLTLKDIMAGLQFVVSSNTDSGSNTHNVNVISSNNDIIPAYDVAVEITNEQMERTIYLYDILVQNDGITEVTINPGDKVFFRPLRDDEIVKTVKVSGFVNRPGVYKFIEGKKLSDMINVAGGLSKNANLIGIVYKRSILAKKEKDEMQTKNLKDVKLLQGQMASDTNATKEDTDARKQSVDEILNDNNNLMNKNAGRIALNIKCNDIRKISPSEDIEIQDGDEIYIPKFSNHVMVIGEVYNETSFIYKKDEKASYYIRLVGGYTPNAARTKIYKVGANGRACKIHLLASNKIEPGDTIIIPRKLRGNDWITPLASSLQAIAGLLTSVFIVTKL